MVSSDISPQSLTPSHRHQNGIQEPDLHLNIKAEHWPLAGVVIAVAVVEVVVETAKKLHKNTKIHIWNNKILIYMVKQKKCP